MVATAKVSTTTASILVIVKGTLKMMTLAKLKISFSLGTAVLVLGTAATLFLLPAHKPAMVAPVALVEEVALVQDVANRQDGPAPEVVYDQPLLVDARVPSIATVAPVELSPVGILEASIRAYASLSAYADNGKTVEESAGQRFVNTFSIRLQRPHLYRVEWSKPVHPSYADHGAVWPIGDGKYRSQHGGVTFETPHMEFAELTGVTPIPALFFGLNWNSVLKHMRLPQRLESLSVETGEAMNVGCYVIERREKLERRVLWIGKEDFLIRQYRLELISPTNPNSKVVFFETHENIVLNQERPKEDFAYPAK